jgi:hypothetical protein
MLNILFHRSCPHCLPIRRYLQRRRVNCSDLYNLPSVEWALLLVGPLILLEYRSLLCRLYPKVLLSRLGKNGLFDPYCG